MDTTNIYTYSGPIFRFGQLYDVVNDITTKAVSKKQAINNILYRLKVNYGFYTNSDLTLDDYYLEEVPDTQKIYMDEIKEITKQGHIKKCDNCGTQLNDSGECPVCDLGDIDYLS